MNTWIQKHSWPLIIAAMGVISTYTLYGYRIDALEKELATQQVQLDIVKQQSVQVQVQLASIAVDISYIKANIDRLLK